jgi:hypothetical protein
VALEGTIDYAAMAQENEPGGKTVVVFVTDGEPGFGYVHGGQIYHLYLLTRLRAIRDAGSQCAFDVPQPSVGATVDIQRTNLAYVSGSGVSKGLLRTRDGTANTCGTSATAWYFDNPSTPTQIRLCPATCTALQQDSNVQLQVVYGCEVQVG